MADCDIERVVCAKNEVFVYQIPARTSNRGYRAAEWNLDQPAWTGRLRCMTKGKQIQIKLEDRNSGELFAMCPVEQYPGIAVEQVLDSSRYFVLKIQDTTGRHAFIGIGFSDRGDSFDFLVSMQDHFKREQREEKEAEQAAQLENGPKLDLGFKEGQTIKINIGGTGEGRKSRPRANAGGGMPGIIPPPPGGMKLPAPPGNKNTVAPPSIRPPTAGTAPPGGQSQNTDLDFLLGDSNKPQPTSQPAAADPWGDFASAGSANQSTNANWVQF